MIYLLRPVKGTSGPQVVLRARCITCARSMAAGAAGAEGPAYWRDPERTTCSEVTQDGRNGIILTDRS